MKKLYVLGLIAALSACVFIGCGSSSNSTEIGNSDSSKNDAVTEELIDEDNSNIVGGDSVINPYVNCESLEALNQTTGSNFSHLSVMGVTNEAFAYINSDDGKTISEYTFDVNGQEYCARYCADFNGDISGIYSNQDGATLLTDKISDDEWYDFTVVSDDTTALAHWVTTDGQYILATPLDNGMSVDTFTTVAEEFSDSTVREDS